VRGILAGLFGDAIPSIANDLLGTSFANMAAQQALPTEYQQQAMMQAELPPFLWSLCAQYQPPRPEPGILWRRTGGKTWRVTVTR